MFLINSTIQIYHNHEHTTGNILEHLITMTILRHHGETLAPAAVSCLSSETSVTSIIKVMMELNRCTTGRASVVTANTTIVTPGYESLPRVSASTQISPQALLLPKYILRVDPKQRHFSPIAPLASQSTPQLWLSGNSRCSGLRRAGWVWAY